MQSGIANSWPLPSAGCLQKVMSLSSHQSHDGLIMLVIYRIPSNAR